MSITYDLDCGDETVTLELLDDGTLISYGFDIENEMIAKEMGFEPHPCFEAMDKALRDATNRGNIDIVELLLAAGVDVHAFCDYALRYSAGGGHAIVVELLLEHRADVHVNDNAALRYAAGSGHADVVRILLEAGADVNEGSLLAAAAHGNADIVKLLLEAGADVHSYNDYALREAKRLGNDDIVKILEDWIKEHG